MTFSSTERTEVHKSCSMFSVSSVCNERQRFEATAKPSYVGGIDGVFTSADQAHAVDLKSLRECFLDTPTLAEEGAGALGTDSRVFFTVDLLDGSPPSIPGVGTGQRP